MKKIFLLIILISLWACSNTNDDASNDDTSDDMSDDSSGDDGNSGLTIDFDVAIMSRDNNFNYYQIEIDNGTNLQPVEQFLQGVNDNSAFSRRLEKNTYFVYSPFNLPDFIVGTHNILSGADNTYVNFIDPGLPKMAHDIFPGEDHIVTFYSELNGNNELDEYFNLYTIASGNYEQVLISSDNLSGIQNTQNGWLTTSFINDQAELYLRIFNLNNTAQQYTVGPVNEYLPFTQVNGKIYMFGNNKYRIFDLNTGVWGNDITTAESIRANTSFSSKIIGNKMYYEALNVQPNGFVSAPAIYNFNTGTNRGFDLGQLKLDWWAASGNQILEVGAMAIKADDEILVLALSYRNANNVDKFGVLFTSYDLEVVSFLEIPHLPLALVIK